MTRAIQLTRIIRVVNEVNYTISVGEDGKATRMRCHFCNTTTRAKRSIASRKCPSCGRQHGPSGLWRGRASEPWQSYSAEENHEYLLATQWVIEKQGEGLAVGIEDYPNRNRIEPPLVSGERIPWRPAVYITGDENTNGSRRMAIIGGVSQEQELVDGRWVTRRINWNVAEVNDGLTPF